MVLLLVLTLNIAVGHSSHVFQAVAIYFVKSDLPFKTSSLGGNPGGRFPSVQIPSVSISLFRDIPRYSRQDLIILSIRSFPGGSVVKNLPASAGDVGSIPGLRRSHIAQSS